MKNFLSILSLTFLLLSCGPSRHAIHVEMRYPSRSGIELAGKIISVVYVSGDNQQGNTVSENMAIGFAGALEKDYATGEGSVGVYSVDGRLGDYAQKDSLVNLLVQTGSDVIFLLDELGLGEKGVSGLPMKVTLHCFDGMNRSDKVQTFTGSKVLSYGSEEELSSEATKAGQLLASSFTAQWKDEQYSIAYYDGTRWYEALDKAERYDWKGAMDIWFGLLDTKDLMKRATAEYNIAVACYMLGDFDLASQWLDKSVKDNDMPTLTKALRTRIDSRKAAM